MPKPYFYKYFISLISITLLLPLCSFAQDQEAIGRVISTTGTVQARSNSGALRELSRRSEIFNQDTIITSTNGFAQLRLVDSGMMSFKADTEFTFEEYYSDGPGGAADSAIMNMVKGGFRSISGSIGDDDQDNYRINTPFASIGIRGTTHEAVIDGNSLLTGVYDGGTTISNNNGSIDTGLGASFDFSQTFQGQPPVGLLGQPGQLGQINLNPGIGNEAADEDDGEPTGGDDGNGAGDDSNGDGQDEATPTDTAESNDETAGTTAESNDNALGFNDLGSDSGTGAGNETVTLGETSTPSILDSDAATLANNSDTAINPTENIRDAEELGNVGADAIELAAIEAALLEAEEEAARVALIEAEEEAARVALLEAEEEAARVALLEAEEEAARVALLEAEEEASRVALLEAEEEAAHIALLEAEEEAARVALLEAEEEAARVALIEAEEEAARVALLEAEEEASRVALLEAEEEAARVALLEAEEEAARVALLEAEEEASRVALLEAEEEAARVALLEAEEEAARVALLEAEEEAARIALLEAEEEAARIALLEAEEEAARIALLEAEEEAAKTLAEAAAIEAADAAEDAQQAAAIAIAKLAIAEQAAVDASETGISLEVAQAAADVAEAAAQEAEDASLAAAQAAIAAADAAETAAQAAMSQQSAIAAAEEAAAKSILAEQAVLAASNAAAAASLAAITAAEAVSLIPIDFFDPVLAASVDRVKEDEKLAFVLPSFFEFGEPGEIFQSNASDGGTNGPVFISNNTNQPRTLDTSPEFIFETDSDIEAAIFQLWNSRGEIQDAFVGFSIETTIYTDYTDASQVFPISTWLNWVSVDPTALETLDILTDNVENEALYTSTSFFLGDYTNYSFYPDDALVRGSLVVDFETNTVSEGFLSIPTSPISNWGGNYYGSTTHGTPCQLETCAFWEVEFDGSINEGYIQGNANSVTSQINNLLTQVNGQVHGIFVEDQATSIIGGYNFFLEPVDTNSSNPAIGQIFVFEREDRLNSEEYRSLQQQNLFVLSTEKNLFSISDFDSSLALNIGSGANYDYYYDDSNQDYLFKLRDNFTPIDLNSHLNDYNPDYQFGDIFDVNWSQWSANTFDLLPNRLDVNNSILINQPVYIATYTPSTLPSVQGHYSGAYAYTGQDANGNEIDWFDIEFDVDFLNGEINNGSLLAIATSGSLGNGPTYDWNIGFSGYLYKNQASLFINDNLSYLYIDNEGAAETHTEITGSIIGSFVDGVIDNNVQQAFAGSFFFEHGEDIDTVSGLFLAHGETENRFSASERSLISQLGFVLPTQFQLQDFDEITIPAIIPGAATANFYGYPIFLDTSLDFESNPFDIEFNPYFVVRGNELNSIPDTQADTIYNSSYEVTFGIWSPSSNLPEILLDPTDPTQSLALNTDVVWATFPVDYENRIPFLSESTTTSYSKNLTFKGLAGEGEQLVDVKAGFDINLSTGEILFGFLDICTDSSPSCSELSFNFDIEFSGDFDVSENSPYLEGIDNLTLFDSDGNPISNSIIGDMQGFFTGKGYSDPSYYDAFVGAFNFSDSTEASAFLTGAYLIEREERILASEIKSLDKDSFLVQEKYASTLLGASRPTTLTEGDTNYNSIIFSDYKSDLIIRNDDESISISRITQGLETLEFGVNWERWEGPLSHFTNNLDASAPLVGNTSDIAYFTNFNISQMSNISGKYSQALGFIGEGDSGTPISELSMAFDVNFSEGFNNISNGLLEIEVGDNETWTVFFDGSVTGNEAFFNLKESDPITGALSQIEQFDPSSSTTLFSNIDVDTEYNNSNIQGVFVDDGTETALLASFRLRNAEDIAEGIAGEAVSGLTLVGHLFDDRFDNDSIGTSGIHPENLDSLGFVLLSNPGNVPDDDFLYSVLASDSSALAPSDRPIFGQLNLDTDLLYPFSPRLDRVFVNENNSSSSDLLITDVGGAQFGINWGIWNSPGNSNNGLSAYTDPTDVGSVENNFRALTWVTVNNPRITSSTGIFTYSRTADFIGEGTKDGSTNRLVRSVQAFFDIDLDASIANVSNGFIEVCSSVSANCIADGDIWSATFDANLNGGILQSTSLIGSINDTQSFDGELTGVFTGFFEDDTNNVYDAFVGGFNFLDNSDSNNYLTGAFLLEREDRLNSSDLMEMTNRIGIIAEHGSDQTVLIGSSTDSNLGSPKIAINIDPSTEQLYLYNEAEALSAPYDLVFSDSTPITPSGSNQNVGGFDVDWGIWDQAGIVNQYNPNNAADADSDFNTDLIWASVLPTDIADLNGEWSYTAGNEFLGLASDGALTGLNMSFSADFGTGAISNGVFDADTAGGTSWNLNFTGNIHDARAQMGSFSNMSINGDAATISGNIDGIFTGTGGPQGFVAGFSLEATTIGYLQGLGLLNGVFMPPPG